MNLLSNSLQLQVNFSICSLLLARGFAALLNTGWRNTSFWHSFHASPPSVSGWSHGQVTTVHSSHNLGLHRFFKEYCSPQQFTFSLADRWLNSFSCKHNPVQLVWAFLSYFGVCNLAEQCVHLALRAAFLCEFLLSLEVIWCKA